MHHDVDDEHDNNDHYHSDEHDNRGTGLCVEMRKLQLQIQETVIAVLSSLHTN